MKKVTLYHGSNREIELTNNRAMYFSTDIDVAKEYALGLDCCGNFNTESWIYSIDVDKDESILIEDFEEFDPIGDIDYENMPSICHNEESGYFCIKNVESLRLIETYKNEL